MEQNWDQKQEMEPETGNRTRNRKQFYCDISIVNIY